MIRLLLALLTLVTLSASAHAQLSGTDTKPGDPCTAQEEGYVRRNASADRNISGITLICDGSHWQSATGGNGLAALQGQNDTGPCTPAKDGLIKYNSSGNPKWEFCDGGTTSWLPFRLPQCLNDDAGECTLATLRNSNDPQFTGANLRCGAQLLGVTGTYGSASSNPFTFADVTSAAPSTLTTAAAITINGLAAGCPGEVKVSGQGSPQISINGGTWSTGGSVANGQTLAVRLVSSASFSTPHTAIIEIGASEDTWSVTTVAADTTPAAFNFTPNVTNAAFSTLTTASAVTITGINTTTPVSVSGAGAQISVNGGAWGTSGTITNGQSLAVRLTSSASPSTTITATVTVGGVMDTWSVSTVAADTTPDAFTFADLTGQALSTLVSSSAITISGINTSTPVSVSAGAQISIDGGTWATSGNIANGQSLAVRLTSSASFSTALSATVTIGGVSDSWSTTTRAANSCTAANKTWLTNCTATVTAAAHGAAGTATIANPGGCGTSYYGSGTFACSDGSFSYSTGSCTQQTACDTTPAAFDFTPNATGAEPDAVTIAANTITIAGINTNTAVSVSGGGGPQISINGGTWVASGTILNGQTLRVRLTASAAFSTAVTATINVGGVTDTWSVTTRAGNACSGVTVSWSNCDAASGAMMHGQTKTVTNTTAGYNGTRDLSCDDGTINQSGGTCTAAGGTWQVYTCAADPPGPNCSPSNAVDRACPTLGALCRGGGHCGRNYTRFRCE